MQRIKIMIVYKSMEIGGIERTIARLLNNLNRNKFYYELVLFSKKGLLLKQIPKSIKVHNLKSVGLLGLLKSVIYLKTLIDSEKPTVVLCFGDYPGLVVTVAKIISNRKPRIVIEMANLMSRWIPYLKLSNIRNVVLKFTLAHADQVITVSKAIKRDLHTNYNLPNKKIDVIYNFLEESDFIPSVPTGVKGKDQNSAFFLYIGRFVKEKNIDLILQAMVYLRKRMRAKLVICGEGPEEKRLLLKAEQLGLSSSVEFHPPQPDIRNELTNCNLLVLTSKVEGHPCTILESMALGTPVLVTKYLGSEELIKNNITGFTIPLNASSMQLAERMHAIVIDKASLSTVSNNAKDFAKKFLVTNLIDKYENIMMGK